MPSSKTRNLRRDLLKLATLFTATGALGSLQKLQAQSKLNNTSTHSTLRIGYLPLTDATPLLVAHANGLFTEQGIEVEKPIMLRSWAQLMEAFISGQVNVIHVLSPMTIWARYASQVPAKVVAWNHISGSALTVAPHINTLKDLGGQTVAIPFHYSIHNVVLQHLLRQANLQPVLHNKKTIASHEVKLTVMAPADMTPSLAAKRIAGFTVADPFNAQAELLNVGKILRFTGDVWRDHACCVVFMHENDLEQRPQWSQAVVNAIVKAQLWIPSNRAETASLLAQSNPHRYTPHSEEILAKVLTPSKEDQPFYIQNNAIQNPEWQNQRIDFQPYPFASYTEELVRQLQVMQFGQGSEFLAHLDPSQIASDLVDNSFVKKAITQLGGPELFGLDSSYIRQEQVR